MQVVIATTEEGTSWKLQTLPDGETLTSSVIYHPSLDECLADLGRHARSWRKHLIGRSVVTVGEVLVVTNGVQGKTLLDLWPDLNEIP